MYNGPVIREMLEARGLKASDLLMAITDGNSGSKRSLHSVVNGNPTAKTLEAVADYFKVPLDALFKREVEFEEADVSAQLEAKVSSLKTEVELYKKLLEEKERTILVLLDKQGVSGQKRDSES